MRIVIDLDGTICELKKSGQSYADVKPLPGVQEKLEKWKAEGHDIVIYTARHMRTCEGNTGKVVARIGSLTLNWLEQHRIPYDEIVFGKPDGDVYIDDKALTFDSWDKLTI